jgi:hypothetical protein
MTEQSQGRLGIIQSRGLGDIVIALPIARHYYEKGWAISWPICREFVAHFSQHVPWVEWIPVTTDSGSFFYDVPLKLLTQRGCDEILPLYQALTNQRFHEEPYFQYTKFDQYKYLRAGVNFLEKWQLSRCLTRDLEEEQRLVNVLTSDRPYVVLHLEGSDYRSKFDRSVIPKDWDQIEITPNKTPSIFNWITLLEGAESIVCVDSVVANLVDQLSIGQDLYLLPRSHIGLTPVYAQPWQWLEKSADK